MELYEIEPDMIVAWAVEFASYEDLEKTSKALYGLYKTRQKETHPDLYKKDKSITKKYKKRAKA